MHRRRPPCSVAPLTLFTHVNEDATGMWEKISEHDVLLLCSASYREAILQRAWMEKKGFLLWEARRMCRTAFMEEIWHLQPILSAAFNKSAAYQWLYSHTCRYTCTFVWVCNYVCMCVAFVFIFPLRVLASEVCVCAIQCVCVCVARYGMGIYVSATVLQSVFHGLAWTQSKAPSCFRSTLNHGSPHRSLILSDSHRPDLTTSVCPSAHSNWHCLVELVPHPSCVTNLGNPVAV